MAPKPSRAEKKIAYDKKLCKILDEYGQILVVAADNVGSNQLQNIRKGLRGDSVVLMGKNTLMKRTVRLHDEKTGNNDLINLIPLLVGNVGLIFTEGDLKEVSEEVSKYKVGAPARVGLVAPIDVIVPPGNTGLDPSQTSFFQVLDIPTKINKETVEITIPVELIKKGDKVGSSEAALLSKIGVRPFSYGLVVLSVYDNGSVFSPEVLDLTDDDLVEKFYAGVSTLAAVPHMFVNGYKNILSVAVASEYSFSYADKVKEYLKDPSKFAVAAAAAAASGGAPAAGSKAEEKKPEPEGVSDEEIGAIEDKQDDENMTSENQAISDGETQTSKETTEKRRDVLQHKPQQSPSLSLTSGYSPPVLDYVTTLNEHKYDPINLFEAADWLKCITNVYPVDQRSDLEREVGMFCRDWLTDHHNPSMYHQDPSQDQEMTSDEDMEKVYESDVYIKVQDLVETFDEDTIVALKRFIDIMPRTNEVLKYQMNFEVVEMYMLHEKMRPWISNIIRSSTDEDGDLIASVILKSMKNYRSASLSLNKVLSFVTADVTESDMLFRKMWEMLFLKTNNLVEAGGVPDVAPSEQLSALKLLDFSETVPKTKAEVLSLEINWAVFDQHELHEKMRPWLAKQVMELLKKKKASVVDQVVAAIKNHNCPSLMLELLKPSLDDSTEIVVTYPWRTLLILVKILETDRVWNTEESSEHDVGVIQRNRHHRHPSFWRQVKMHDFEMLCEQNRLKSTIPRNIEELSSVEVDWDVSDKLELHNILKPWIFGEIMEFVRPEEVATSLVDSILSKIKDHANAEAVWELVKPSLGKRSKVFLLNLWMQLIFMIHLARNTVELDPFLNIDEERSDKEGDESLQYGDRFSRNRHFMMVTFDYENLLKLKQISEAMPKTKEELFSYEINWDVCGKHQLRKRMREGIWVETLDLIRQKQGAGPVDQIMWSIFDYHVSASRNELDSQLQAIFLEERIMSCLDKEHACPYKMLAFLEPIFGSSGSEKLVMKMWYSLISGIKFAEERVERMLKPGWGSAVLLPPVDEYPNMF